MAVDKMRHYKQLLQSTPELERFSINGETSCQHALDDEQVFELVNALRLYQSGRDSTIEEVVLESFAISRVGWKSLSGAVCKLFRLKKLFLRRVLVISPYATDDWDCEDEDDEDEDEGVDLVGGLSGLTRTCCPHLEELHLVDCDIHATACQRLVRDWLTKPSQTSRSSSSSFPTLNVLSLEDNPIGEAGVRCIANALRGNISLIALDLDRVGCSKSGMAVLAEALKENNCLEILSIAGNIVPDATPQVLIDDEQSDAIDSNGDGDGDGGSTAHHQVADGCPLCNLLSKNTRLKRVQLQANDVLPSSSSRQLDFLLRLNRRGRQYLGDADVMSKIFHLMLGSSSKDADVLYYFLKSQSGYMRH
eukprot:jgi/Psemu1/306966/fgenesh1_kg.293_\